MKKTHPEFFDKIHRNNSLYFASAFPWTYMSNQALLLGIFENNKNDKLTEEEMNEATPLWKGYLRDPNETYETLP